MANVYYGDGYTNSGDGNWNHAGNWYSALGFLCCGTPVAGVALGRVPAPGDSVVITGIFGSGLQLAITTGPSNWAGPLTWNAGMTTTLPLNDPAATYSGTVTLDVTVIEIRAGNFTGLVQVQKGTVAGGVFTGTVTRSAPLTNSSFTGGTYSPTVGPAPVSFTGPTGCELSGFHLTDPGFAIGGGVFTPVIQLTGVP